jgi:hypothetical protein
MLNPLPDVFSPEWFAALRDVLSLGLAALGAWLAWLAIRMGREQARVAAQQQTIVDVQHRMFLERTRLDSRLRVEKSFLSRGVRFTLVNTGTTIFQSISWRMKGLHRAWMRVVELEAPYELRYTDEEQSVRSECPTETVPNGSLILLDVVAKPGAYEQAPASLTFLITVQTSAGEMHFTEFGYWDIDEVVACLAGCGHTLMLSKPLDNSGQAS